MLFIPLEKDGALHQKHAEKRFDFGKNWQSFLGVVDEERIHEAEISIQRMLDRESLEQTLCLDVGCGSGLFSLAARRLGARVHSFDQDPRSVEAARAMKGRFLPEDALWTIERASVLDRNHMRSLGKFDIVYAWGVLHHTGAMWDALANAAARVAPGGRLFVSIYNHQELWSTFYRQLKRAYVRAPRPGRWVILGSYIAVQTAKGFIKDICLLRNPLLRYRARKGSRGMSIRHDWIDWVGGYPFETAKPEDVFHFVKQRGFSLQKMKTCGAGKGCNEFVFLKTTEDSGKE
jgi:2-polyprenyl-6-hydroxyphenyl methylase/3-demethylubiquinone-9 3-methyltransferase